MLVCIYEVIFKIYSDKKKNTTFECAWLIDRLQNYTGVQGQVLRWFRSYLSGRFHFVYLIGESSQLSPVKYGVPQGSLLGPLLFSIHMLPLPNIIRKYGISFHCYADDTQLYISTIPYETSKLSELTECVKNVKDWMTNNFLLLNSDKKDILLIGQYTDSLGSQFATRRMYCYFLYSQKSGCYIRQQLVFWKSYFSCYKNSFFHFRNIAKLQNMLSVSDAVKLVHVWPLDWTIVMHC